MKENIKKITILIIASIIVSILLNVIFLKTNLYSEKYIIDRVIIIFSLVSFIGMHFVFGIKKLYKYIVNHRYIIAGIMLILLTIFSYNGSSMGIISNYIFEEENNNTLFFYERNENIVEYSLETLFSIGQKQSGNKFFNSNLGNNNVDMFTFTNAPVKDILTIGKIANIGYLFLNSDMAYSFWWNFRIIALFLVSFELCMLISNKNKFYSLAGTIIIALSSVVSWRYSYSMIDVMIYGQAIIVLFNLFFKIANNKLKILSMLGLSWAIISYIFTFDTQSRISFGYIFIALFIWSIIKNVKEKRITKKSLNFFAIPIIIVSLFIFRYYNISGEFINLNESARNNNGLSLLFSYTYGILLPFMDIKNAYYFSNIISVFPIPLIICFWYLYKKEEHTEFLFPMAVVCTLEIIHCLSGLPQFVSNITLFKYVSVESAAIAIGLANVYLYIYILSNIKEKVFNIKQAIRITLITACIIVFVKMPQEISSKQYISLFSMIYCLLAFLLLRLEKENYKKVFVFFSVMFTIISSFNANPITKGVSIIDESKFAKAIQEINQKDKEALWITEGDSMLLANYAFANNSKVLNTTAIVENKELFVKALGEELAEEKKNIWNRFTNIEIKISDKNDVELKENSSSTILLYLTKEKLEELNVKYIISYLDEEKIEEKGINVEKIYENSSKININENAESGENTNKSLYIYEVL